MSKKTPISGYDKAVVLGFKKFIGPEFKALNERFTPNLLAGTWFQVMSSFSTSLLGSSSKYSSVKAKYTLNGDGVLGVTNEAFDKKLRKINIEGTSRARNQKYQICRTVSFNGLNFEGDYWIIYMSPSSKSFIICAPLILNIFGKPLIISNNFAVYVITQNIDVFWSDSKEFQPIFDALEKYKFTNFFNRANISPRSFD